MRIRTTGLTLFAGLSILVAACSSSTASSAPSTAPSTAPSAAAPSTAASTAPASTKPASDLKIGVVTDVGSVNDKNFNQYSYTGAVNGAVSIGAKTPAVVVPKATSDYVPLLQAYVDKGYNVIIGVGFNLQNPVATMAKKYPNICSSASTTTRASTPRVTSTRPSRTAPASSPTCCRTTSRSTTRKTRPATSPGSSPRRASKSGIIGAIGGIALCGPCVRYIQGYELGAKSVNPNIKVETA